MNWNKRVLFVFLSLSLAAFAATLWADSKPAETKPPGKIAGQLEEACKCNAAARAGLAPSRHT